jgi:2-polyprenyl-3-methyl-5-hydroxy-6-metoxy-1,4-benzoquinol methylase
MDTVRADFDRIALLTEVHNLQQFSRDCDYLLRQIPQPCHRAMEIGCGAGAFSRLLANRAERVLALDLSPQMIRIAQERKGEITNIDYQVADVLTYEFPPAEFDCVVAVATLHHLPMEPMLLKLRASLKEGGMLLVLDLYQRELLRELVSDTLALPVSVLLRLVKEGRLRPPAEVRAAWAEHEKHDKYLTIREVSAICARLLPGARVHRHFLWRYSLVWKKPKQLTIDN